MDVVRKWPHSCHFYLKKKKLVLLLLLRWTLINSSPQWGAADAEIKVPPGENTELKRSPFKVLAPQWGAADAEIKVPSGENTEL